MKKTRLFAFTSALMLCAAVFPLPASAEDAPALRYEATGGEAVFYSPKAGAFFVGTQGTYFSYFDETCVRYMPREDGLSVVTVPLWGENHETVTYYTYLVTMEDGYVSVEPLYADPDGDPTDPVWTGKYYSYLNESLQTDWYFQSIEFAASYEGAAGESSAFRALILTAPHGSDTAVHFTGNAEAKLTEFITADTPAHYLAGEEGMLDCWTVSVPLVTGREITDDPVCAIRENRTGEQVFRIGLANGVLDPGSLEMPNTFVMGDCNYDGVFTAADLVMLQKYLLCDGDLNLWHVADYDFNEKINAADLSIAKRTLAALS